MLNDLIAVLATASSGLVAGVFLAVALSVIPALAELPVRSYIDLHLRLGRGYHPVMPLVVGVVLLADGWLAVVVCGSARPWFAFAVLCDLGVQGVSHLRNERLNRTVRAVQSGPTAGWRDPRPAWRRWHQARLVLSIASLLVNAAALAMLG